MTGQAIEKYSLSVRIVHWVHTGAFIILFLTGITLFVPRLGFLAVFSYTRFIHRAAAGVFIVIPLLYLIIKPRTAGRGLKQAFTWGAADIGWFKAAPAYFFLGDEKAAPPQGALNSGQKLWWLITIVFGFVSIITGLVMWLGVQSAPLTVSRWIVIVHDISFIVTGAMLFLHIYLGVFHPMLNEAWQSMTGGKISIEYARKHHAKWYEEVTRGQEEKTE
jgi:formate dehydrogenase subunit gamma